MSTPSDIIDWSPWTEIDEHVNKISETVKPEVEEKMGNKVPVYVPLNYREGRFAGGAHYEIKVYVGDDTLLILRLAYLPLLRVVPPTIGMIIKFPLPTISIISKP